MSLYLRDVKTASGATAVQIVEKNHGVRLIVEHLGSAQTPEREGRSPNSSAAGDTAVGLT